MNSSVLGVKFREYAKSLFTGTKVSFGKWTLGNSPEWDHCVAGCVFVPLLPRDSFRPGLNIYYYKRVRDQKKNIPPRRPPRAPREDLPVRILGGKGGQNSFANCLCRVSGFSNRLKNRRNFRPGAERFFEPCPVQCLSCLTPLPPSLPPFLSFLAFLPKRASRRLVRMAS